MTNLLNPTFLENYFDRPTDRLVTKFLKVDHFLVTIQLAPWPSSDSERREHANLAYDHLYQGFVQAGLRKSNIKLDVPLNNTTSEKNAAVLPDAWMKALYDEPGSEFMVALSDKDITFGCSESHLESIVRLASGVFPHILTTFLSEELNTALKVRLRASAVHYSFKNQFRLGDHIAQHTPVINCELLSQALLGLQEIPKKQSSWEPYLAYHSLGRESFVRLDFNYHATRKYSDLTYNIKLRVEAPFNEGNRLLYVTPTLSMEEEFGFDLERILHLKVPLVEFYRDTILRQFLAHLLVNTNFTT